MFFSYQYYFSSFLCQKTEVHANKSEHMSYSTRKIQKIGKQHSDHQYIEKGVIMQGGK